MTKDRRHPSHETRVSIDASSYDEVCINCGATDQIGSWGDLRFPCVADQKTAVYEPWHEYRGDFNAMTDEEIEKECEVARRTIDEEESWLEAVAAWTLAGKPRSSLHIEKRPSNCRNRLRDEGKPYPKSGCASCGTGGLTGCPHDL